jgi:hypothetical protein
MQHINFMLQHFEKQAHQTNDFIGRPVPVFTTEGKQRERLDPSLSTGLYDSTGTFNTRPMPQSAGMAALFRPATITIHNYGYMLRQIFYERGIRHF